MRPDSPMSGERGANGLRHRSRPRPRKLGGARLQNVKDCRLIFASALGWSDGYAAWPSRELGMANYWVRFRPFGLS